MLDPVENRIAERNKVVEERMRHEGPVGRMFSRIGLTLASGEDRIESIVNNDVTAFAGGSIYGAIQGGLLGSIAWIALLSLTPIPATIAALTLVVGGSMLAFGVYHGINAVRDHEAAKNETKIAYRIASPSGGVSLQQKIRDATLQRQRDESAINGAQTYAQIEQERRERREELGDHHHHR